jgi:hypothetical protein
MVSQIGMECVGKWRRLWLAAAIGVFDAAKRFEKRENGCKSTGDVTGRSRAGVFVAHFLRHFDPLDRFPFSPFGIPLRPFSQHASARPERYRSVAREAS